MQSLLPQPQSAAGRLRSRRNGAPHAAALPRLGRPRQRLAVPSARSSRSACCSAAAHAAEAPAAAEPRMQWSTFVSRRINLDLAVEEAVTEALRGFGGTAAAAAATAAATAAAPELAVVFISSAFVQDYDKLVPELRRRLPSLKTIFGSTGYGVIGSTSDGPEEIEHAPAVSIALGYLPGVDLRVTRVTSGVLPDGDAPPDAWAQLLGVPLSRASSSSFLVLSDPRFGQVEELLAGLDYAFPDANKIGGLTSAGKMSPARGLFAWQQGQAAPDDAPALFTTGAAVLSLSGALGLELMVAQGCRPLTPHSYTITRVQPGPSGGVLVLGLSRQDWASGKEVTPLEALARDLKGQFDTKGELTSLLSNLALGVAPGGLRSAESLEPQDFLIRGVLLEKLGYMLVLDTVRVGERVRFMLRGRAGAMEDLNSHGLAYKRRQLAAIMEGRQPARAFGMLLFSCNGRGTNLYDQPSYDSRTLGSYVPVPCSGFLCNGEIGTVGGSTKLHGFTCAAAILHERQPAAAAAAAAEAPAAAGAAAAAAASEAQPSARSSSEGVGQSAPAAGDAAAASSATASAVDVGAAGRAACSAASSSDAAGGGSSSESWQQVLEEQEQGPAAAAGSSSSSQPLELGDAAPLSRPGGASPNFPQQEQSQQQQQQQQQQ